jgi:FkbM family methyltransferase
MLTVRRHGTELRFDDEGFTETPWVYRPLVRERKLYEERFLEHIRSLDRRGVYVDVGAHLGTHTVWFASLCPATHVHAFEPVGRFAGVVQRNLAANGVSDRVTLHRVGLSDRAGRASNRLSLEHQVGFVDEAAATDESFEIVRLDKVVRRGPVAVLKLDVEGMEAAALRGAGRILSKWRPAVFAEAHSPAAAEEIGQVLRRYGYQPTGRVFNATPTYEFTAPPRRGLERLRPWWFRLPAPIGRRLARKTGHWDN